MLEMTPDDAAVLAAAKVEIESGGMAATATPAASIRRPASAIIEDYLRDTIDPIFRRNENLWSRSRGRQSFGGMDAVPSSCPAARLGSRLYPLADVLLVAADRPRRWRPTRTVDHPPPTACVRFG
jgi:hypothetical protein